MAGHVVTIIGGKGGVGKSQFSANLAFAFAAETKQKVLLLDFDQKASGDQNFITGMKSKKTIKDLSEYNGSIDPRSVMQFVSGHPSGVQYIGMPDSPTAAASVDSEGVGKLLKSAPNLYPLTVIDGGSELTPLTLKALEYSTAIFLVVTPDILALNQTRRLYSELVTMLFPKEMLLLVGTQMQKGHPVTPDVMGKTVGKPVFATIPKDDQTCVSALNAKKPVMVVNKTSPYARGVTECVRKIVQKNVLRSLEKLNKPKEVNVRASSSTTSGAAGTKDQKGNSWTALKSRIHKTLVDEMDLKKTDSDDPKAMIILREQTKKMVVEILNKEDTKGILNGRDDMSQIVKEVLDEALGLEVIPADLIQASLIQPDASLD